MKTVNNGSHELHCHIDCKDDWQRDMFLGILERLDNISDIYVQYEGNARIYFTSTDGKISEAIFSSVWIDD